MTFKLSSDRLVLLTVYWRIENRGRYPVIGRLLTTILTGQAKEKKDVSHQKTGKTS